jgi:putative flavoprotein involved in K+ transport
MTHLLTVDTPIGKKIQAEGNHHGTPLGRATRNEVASSGVKLSPKVADIQDGFPKLEDGQILDVEGVLWATGYRPYFEWIKLPIFDENEYPIHSRGVVKDTPGLYFLGLLFQSGLSSSLLGGVGKDAAYITSKISR